MRVPRVGIFICSRRLFFSRAFGTCHIYNSYEFVGEVHKHDFFTKICRRMSLGSMWVSGSHTRTQNTTTIAPYPTDPCLERHPALRLLRATMRTIILQLFTNGSKWYNEKVGNITKVPTLCYVMLDAFLLVAYTDLFPYFVRVVCLLCADVSVVILLGFFPSSFNSMLVGFLWYWGYCRKLSNEMTHAHVAT